MKTYLVIGSSRSGTSLTASILHKSGISMGQHFTSPSFQNPRGFYEDLDFVNFNAGWLRKAGGSFNHPPSSERINETAIENRAASFLQSTITAKTTTEYGVKDPRIVWLWPFYARAFRDLNPHLIVTRRNISDIACSLVAAGWAEDIAQGVEIAVSFDERLTQIVKETTWPTLELHFEQWREGRRRQEERLEAFVGRRLNFEHVQFAS